MIFMQTPLISIVYFAIAAMLGALGQFLYKTGADKAGGSVMSYLGNIRLLGGVLCYIAVMALFVAAFKKVDLSLSCILFMPVPSSGLPCWPCWHLAHRSSSSMWAECCCSLQVCI